MGLAVGTAKYLLFFFNFMFFVTGIAIMSVGGVALNKFGKINVDLEGAISSPAILLIVVGVFVTIISFFGCCGAIRNSYCMLITFSILLALVFILELAAGIAAYVKKDSLLDSLENSFYKSLNQSKNDTEKQSWWNDLQKEEHCCGVKSSADWKPDPPESCRNGTSEPPVYYNEGCFNWLKNYIIDNIVIIGGVGVGIAFVQILGIVYACCLASAVKEMS